MTMEEEKHRKCCEKDKNLSSKIDLIIFFKSSSARKWEGKPIFLKNTFLKGRLIRENQIKSTDNCIYFVWAQSESENILFSETRKNNKPKLDQKEKYSFCVRET